MRLFVLARSHRDPTGVEECSACRRFKRNVAPIVVAPEGPGEVMRLSVCSGCVRSMLDTASGGRRPERP